MVVTFVCASLRDVHGAWNVFRGGILARYCPLPNFSLYRPVVSESWEVAEWQSRAVCKDAGAHSLRAL